MKSGMIVFIGTAVIAAVIPLSAQTQDPAASQKPKAKHVYTDADLRPLDEKCADPSVPVEEKTSCPKAAVTKNKDAATSDAAKSAANNDSPKVDENGDPIPQEPDLTKMGTDALNERILEMQTRQNSAQESIDKWSQRLAAAQTDDEKKLYQKLVDTGKTQLKDATEKRKAAEDQLAKVSKQS